MCIKFIVICYNLLLTYNYNVIIIISVVQIQNWKGVIKLVKSSDNKTYRDILKSMEIINNSIDDGINVDDLQDMFVKTYLKTLKKEGK